MKLKELLHGLDVLELHADRDAGYYRRSATIPGR